MILPVVKLGTLALKFISKPIANRFKKQAAFHPKFRGFIVTFAQANHRLTTHLQRRIYGHSTNVAIRPLNEEKAIQAASDLLGELCLFMVGGAAVTYEVQRNSKAEARKEELRKQEIQALQQRDEDLEKDIEFVRNRLQELEQQQRRQLPKDSKPIPAA